jgi:hypothetical protein
MQECSDSETWGNNLDRASCNFSDVFPIIMLKQGNDHPKPRPRLFDMPITLRLHSQTGSHPITIPARFFNHPAYAGNTGPAAWSMCKQVEW